MDIRLKYWETRAKLFREEGIKPLSRIIAIKGRTKKVHYLELGKGKPLVLLHGGLSHSSEWANILGALSANFHLFVVDRPGHGLTDPIDYREVDFRKNAVEFIESFMNGINIEKAFFLGNSLGGYFSICFALAHPDRAEKLVLIGAPAGLNRWIPPMLRILGIAGLNRILMKTIAKPSIAGNKKIYRQLLVADIDKVSDRFLEHSHYNHLLPKTDISMGTMLQSILSLMGWKKRLNLVRELDGLQIPVHFIWGAKDTFENPETGRKKAAVIPDHTFEVVENAGHCPWLDKPDKCVNLILKALQN